MSNKTIIIVGGALAGPAAASRAREIDGKARIILLERNTRVSYALAGLSFHLSGEVKSLEELNREREDYFRQVYQIEVQTRTEVKRIDPKKKTLLVVSHGKEEILSYDRLIFATGASSIHPEGLPKVSNFRYFRTLDDLAAIKQSLKKGKKRILILGGGSMGLEALDGCVRGGAEVTLIEKEKHILPQFSENISKLVEEKLSKKAKLLTGVNRLEFITKNDSVTEVIADGKKIKCDFIVSAIGVYPRTELLKEAGVKLQQDGTILVNEFCQTNIPHIYACSICVSVPSPRGPVWIPQAAVSDKTAQVAGANAAGDSVKLGVFSASMQIRLPEWEVGRVGLTEKEALLEAGKNNLGKVLILAKDKEPYLPGSSEITLELFFHLKSGKLLGLEAVGTNIKSRLDAFAAAFTLNGTIVSLAQSDFAYTPAFGTARDALNIAATVALQTQKGQTKIVEPSELKRNRKDFFLLDVSLKKTKNKEFDDSIPLESLRTSLKELKTKLEASRKNKIAVISDSGRRGHLAFCILKENGMTAFNVIGGKKLYSLFGD